MKIELYHGSDKIVSRPGLGLGNPANDYGPGFYCTKELALAYEWACTDSHTGFANKYELDTNGLDILHLNDGRYHLLNWLAILLENRFFDITAPLPARAKEYILTHFLPDYKSRDLIIGYRADDSYFSFAKAFLNNTISLEQLGRAMRLGHLGEQVVIRSAAAYKALYYLASAMADRDIYYPRRMARDASARKQFRDIQAEDARMDAVYIFDIIRQNWQNDDPRLR